MIKAAGTGVGNLPIGQGWNGVVDGSDEWKDNDNNNHLPVK